ncbi:hypothetical protein Fmac_021927 [Flemingia macrophylla]|uniref:Protein kinase domain-containing protein n=1 Tax=Flemingia macrophylla TaxID=520843 RepID=A0ABD1LY88_9FABA
MSICEASKSLRLEKLENTLLNGSSTPRLKIYDFGYSKGVPIFALEDNNDLDFDFEKGRPILTQGVELYVKTLEGICCGNH